jgi:hypothetical protein
VEHRLSTTLLTRDRWRAVQVLRLGIPAGPMGETQANQRYRKKFRWPCVGMTFAADLVLPFTVWRSDEQETAGVVTCASAVWRLRDLRKRDCRGSTPGATFYCRCSARQHCCAEHNGSRAAEQPATRKGHDDRRPAVTLGRSSSEQGPQHAALFHIATTAAERGSGAARGSTLARGVRAASKHQRKEPRGRRQYSRPREGRESPY